MYCKHIHKTPAGRPTDCYCKERCLEWDLCVSLLCLSEHFAASIPTFDKLMIQFSPVCSKSSVVCNTQLTLYVDTSHHETSEGTRECVPPPHSLRRQPWIAEGFVAGRAGSWLARRWVASSLPWISWRLGGWERLWRVSPRGGVFNVRGSQWCWDLRN